MLEMGKAFLPIDNSWQQYLATADSVYNTLESSVQCLFTRLANDAVSMINEGRYRNDPWLWDLDWTTQDFKLNKGIQKKKQPQHIENPQHFSDLEATIKRVPKKPPHLAGYPKWYTELVDQSKSAGSWFGPNLLSPQMRIVPKLLRLTWNGYLVMYDEKHGWGYIVPDSSCTIVSDDSPYLNFPSTNALKIYQDSKMNGTSFKHSDLQEDGIFQDVEEVNSHRIGLARMIGDAKRTKDVGEAPPQEIEFGPMKEPKPPIPVEPNALNEGVFCPDVHIKGFKFFRIPHKDGIDNRVGNPLSKTFISRFADGTLRANCGESGNRIVEVGQLCSYWKNNRDRISDQLTIWTGKNGKRTFGMILPRVITAGTVTRRAVEPTWLTASNARKDRLGSELKAMVHAPEGYHFVGADVDSQELWIAAVIGDAFFSHIHGGTALGWMTLQGNKNEGTDMHSKTAATLAVTRDDAKIINYGRIYGAGRVFAERLLQQFNSKLSTQEAKERVEKMYAQTKGIIRFMPVFDEKVGRLVRKRMWVGGSESAMFNQLEEIARSPHPKTPVLNCSISRALEPANVHGDFITSRINWVVQSSAVDYLHLMLVATQWLFQCYGVNGRFSISIHDEVRYLVKSEHRFKAALALHVANLLTRAMFAKSLGFDNLPASVAFFSSVDIDTCLRKEPFYDCVTPSNEGGLEKTYGIKPGLTLSLQETLEKLGEEEINHLFSKMRNL